MCLPSCVCICLRVFACPSACWVFARPPPLSLSANLPLVFPLFLPSVDSPSSPPPTRRTPTFLNASGSVLLKRGLRLRMGIDYGQAMVRLVPRTGRLDYVGKPLNRAARIAAKAKAATVRYDLGKLRRGSAPSTSASVPYPPGGFLLVLFAAIDSSFGHVPYPPATS